MALFSGTDTYKYNYIFFTDRDKGKYETFEKCLNRLEISDISEEFNNIKQAMVDGDGNVI